MASFTTADKITQAAAAGYDGYILIDGESTAGTATFLANSFPTMVEIATTEALPSLAGGVTGYIATHVALSSSVADMQYLVAKAVHFGSLDISTNTYTADASMPTITELGAASTVTY